MIGNYHIIGKRTIDPQNYKLESKNINGFLEYFVIKNDKKINIKIFLLEYPDIVLYRRVDLPKGINFLPVRFQPINSEHERINYSYEKYLIKGKIGFDIIVAKDTEVEVTTYYA